MPRIIRQIVVISKAITKKHTINFSIHRSISVFCQRFSVAFGMSSSLGKHECLSSKIIIRLIVNVMDDNGAMRIRLFAQRTVTQIGHVDHADHEMYPGERSGRPPHERPQDTLLRK